MNKKAITTLIAWIFIMIAGAMLLLMFALIATDRAKAVEEELAVKALDRLRTILTTQQATSDVSAVIPVPDREIVFTCYIDNNNNNFIVSDIRIGGIPEPTRREMFVGDDFSSPQLFVFSKQLSLPYDIGSVLFLSGESEILYLDKSYNPPMTRDDDIYQRISDNLPEGYRIAIKSDYSNSDIPDSINYDNARYVIFTHNDDDINYVFSGKLKRKAGWSIIQVYSSSSDPFEQGKIYFYTCDGTQNTCARSDPVPYVGLPMMLSYIWQGNYEKAKCQEQKIKNEYQRITSLQLARFEKLYAAYTEYYNAEDDTFDPRYEACRELYVPAKLAAAKSASEDGFDNNFLLAINDVELKNEQLIRGVRCATIY